MAEPGAATQERWLSDTLPGPKRSVVGGGRLSISPTSRFATWSPCALTPNPASPSAMRMVPIGIRILALRGSPMSETSFAESRLENA